MAEPFVYRRFVQFHDTDTAGIVHFSNFFRFMEEAEVAFLRSHGLHVSWREGGQRLGFPRVAASCDFFKPCRFEDEIEVHVRVDQVGTKSVCYVHEIRRGTDLLAKGKITAVCIRGGSDKLESIEIPADIRAKLMA